MRKQSDKYRICDILGDNWPELFKKVNAMKTKTGGDNGSRLKDTQNNV